MSTDKFAEEPAKTRHEGTGLKRRDLLLSGSSLVAASAFSAVRGDKLRASAATNAGPGARANRTAAQYRRHHGGRYRYLEYRRLSSWHDGRPDAEPRQDRGGRHAVYRLLRRGELHRRPRQLHHRRAADPHRHDNGRPGRRPHRLAGGGRDRCHRAKRHGLCHRPVRQEPPRRQERVSADTARLRRSSSATCITSTRWKIRLTPVIRRSC